MLKCLAPLSARKEIHQTPISDGQLDKYVVLGPFFAG